MGLQSCEVVLHPLLGWQVGGLEAFQPEVHWEEHGEPPLANPGPGDPLHDTAVVDICRYQSDTRQTSMAEEDATVMGQRPSTKRHSESSRSAEQKTESYL